MSYSFFNTTQDNSTINNDTTINGSINLPEINKISPYLNIKSLIETPNKSNNHQKSLLSEKVKQHQNEYYNDFNKNNKERGNYDINAFSHSVFSRNKDISNIRNGNGNGNGSDKIITDLSKIGSNNGNSKESISKGHVNNVTNVNLLLNDDCVKVAIGRIVKKDDEIRKLMICSLIILIVRFCKSIIKLFVYTHPIIGNSINKFSKMVSQLKVNDKFDFIFDKLSEIIEFENILKFFSYSETIIQIILISIIINSVYRLIKPIDRCLDLPLTKSQRKVLGLDDENYDIEDNLDDDNGESITQKMQLASQIPIEKPTRITIPDSKNIEDVMGGLNNLVLRGGNSNSNNNININTDVGNSTWSSGMFNEKRREMISPSGKYLYGVNNELRNSNRSFY